MSAFLFLFAQVGNAPLPLPVNLTPPVIQKDYPSSGEMGLSSLGTWEFLPEYPVQTVRWFVDGVFSGGTDFALYYAGAPAGTQYYCEVTSFNADDVGTAANSNTITLLLPPVNTVLPTITNLGDGRLEVTNFGTWDNGPTSYNIQWLLNGSPSAFSGSILDLAAISPSGTYYIIASVNATNEAGTGGSWSNEIVVNV